MEKARKLEIAKAIIAQLENNAEAATFEGRICSKVNDEKGMEQVKTRLTDLQKRIDAANELIMEIEKEQ